MHSHFTKTENNEKKSQFIKLPLTLPYSSAKAAIGIQAMELHVCERSMSHSTSVYLVCSPNKYLQYYVGFFLFDWQILYALFIKFH